MNRDLSICNTGDPLIIPDGCSLSSCRRAGHVLGYRPCLPAWSVRHGATQWIRQGRHTGRPTFPFSNRPAAGPPGRRLLRSIGFTGFSQVITSPLQRAADTCALAGFERRLDPDLVEWDYGAYEGITTAEIQGTVPPGTCGTTACPRGRRRQTSGDGPTVWSAGPGHRR